MTMKWNASEKQSIIFQNHVVVSLLVLNTILHKFVYLDALKRIDYIVPDKQSKVKQGLSAETGF